MDKRLIPSFALSPLRELARLENEINRLFKELVPEEKFEAQVTVWSPRVDMYEKDNNLIVEAEIPGATKENIEVKVKDNSIIIKGEVKREEEKKEENYYRSERFYGKFERILPLPTDVKLEEAKASFENGILKLNIPKVSQEKEIKIDIS
ncbi:MAG: Hsp20/alpha crystallin family protein [Hydrogenothermaceae bacterium]|nr:Hsp20/alpha crystallin family protein [Hydrogenothermaceae bacterium]